MSVWCQLTVGIRTGWTVKQMLNITGQTVLKCLSVWETFPVVSCDSAHRVYECLGVQQGALSEWEEQPCEDQHHRDASRLLPSCCKPWPLHLPVFFSEFSRTYFMNIMFYKSISHISTIMMCTKSSATPLKQVRNLKSPDDNLWTRVFY